MALGADAYSVAEQGYQLLKVLGPSAGLDPLRMVSGPIAPLVRQFICAAAVVRDSAAKLATTSHDLMTSPIRSRY